jgi:hypothetical protein
VAFTVGERIKETSTTEGTGTLTLAGAATGFQSFSDGVGSGNSTYYTIENATDWEVGIGKMASGSTLDRNTVIASSNAGEKVPWAAGSRDVFVSGPAVAALYSTRVETGTSYTVLATDSVIFCGNSSDMALTLPTASESTVGLRYQIQKIADNTAVVTIADGASAQVDHSTNLKLYLQGDMVELVCAYDGSGYEWLALALRLKKHSASLRQTSSQSPSSGYFRTEFDTVDFEYGADGDLTNERIEIKRAGVYDCFTYLSLNNVSSSWANVYIGLNGYAADDLKMVAISAHSGNHYVHGSMILDLAVGDYIYCVGWHNEMGGVSTNISSVRLQPRLQVSEV